MVPVHDAPGTPQGHFHFSFSRISPESDIPPHEHSKVNVVGGLIRFHPENVGVEIQQGCMALD